MTYDADAAYPYGERIDEAVSRHARIRPDAVAVVRGDVRLTYRELDAAGDHYATLLRARGVTEGRRVPVLMGRTPEYVAVLLAVLKCGAAYATLGRQWPAPRLQAIAARLRPPLAVVDEPRDLGVPVWSPYDHPPRAGARPDDRPAPAGDGGTEACVFFTSGSTGVPKGVISPHRATTRLFRPHGFADFGPGHVTASCAALPWDAASLELWGPLVSGGTVALLEDDYLLPEGLAGLVRRQGVDTVWLTASLFNTLLDEDPACFSGLRHVLTGGERLSPRHVRRFLVTHPDVRLTNGYGPVETCVFATTHEVSAADTERPHGIPIGRPVPHTRVHVLRDGRECSPGETGEICVGGDGLATAYLDLPEETAARFVPTVVAGETVRLYRTGDLGFTTPDGLVHYVGRSDRQVKIRGRRIEPLEIENACLALPSVAQAVTVPVTGPDGTCTGLLLCYTTDRAAVAAATPQEVRARLVERLPAHCVPDTVRRVAAIPLTTNGKTDTRRLLAAAAGESAVKAADAAGESPRKGPQAADWSAPRRAEAVAVSPEDGARPASAGPDASWGAVVLDEFRRLLGPDVGPGTSLTAAGGSSLDAIRLCARLSARTGVPVPVSTLLRRPTAAGVAALLAEGAEPAPPGPAADGGGSDPRRVPLHGIQANFALLHELDPSDATALCPLLWKVTRPLDPTALRDALADVQLRHEALRAAYLLDPEPVAVVPETSAPVRLEVLAPAAGQDVAARVRQELNRPLPIEDGQVWRCVYAPADDDTALLGLTVHHIAFDSWSQDLLVADLAHAYEARARGGRPHFAEPAPTLREVADEAAAFHDPQERARQLRYWRDRLAGLPELHLPAPDPGAAGQPYEGLSFTVDPDTAARLRRCAADLGTTVFVPLAAGYAAAVAEATGQGDFGIGVPLVRRPGPRSAAVVSCLVDVVCLRLPAPGGAVRLEELARAAHPAVTGAFAHQDVAFAEVVRAVNAPRTGRNPLYQTMFACQNVPVRDLALCGVKAEAVPVAPAAAMHEVVCEVWPTGDGGLRVDIGHQAHRVARETVHRIARGYEELLHTGTLPATRVPARPGSADC